MAITAQDVKKLRDLTNAGMMDCKKALTEANGDFDRARDILRERGQLVAAKRADREAKDGETQSLFERASSEGYAIVRGYDNSVKASPSADRLILLQPEQPSNADRTCLPYAIDRRKSSRCPGGNSIRPAAFLCVRPA